MGGGVSDPTSTNSSPSIMAMEEQTITLFKANEGPKEHESKTGSNALIRFGSQGVKW